MTKPIIVREDGTVGPAGLKLIEQMASEHKTQRTIAAALGMTLKKFEKLLEKNKGENEERYAWERGFAVIEQHMVDALRGAATGDVIETDMVGDDGDPVIDEATGEHKKVRVRAPVSKSHILALIYYTKTQLGWTEKPQGALVQDNRIQITLAKAMGFGEMLYALGQKEVLDFRKDKTVPLKDITPKWAQLEAPPKSPEGQ